MYGFCGNNGLYSATLSFTICIFLLTSFDNWDSYYFEWNLSSPIIHLDDIVKKMLLNFEVLKKDIREGVSIEG